MPDLATDVLATGKGHGAFFLSPLPVALQTPDLRLCQIRRIHMSPDLACFFMCLIPQKEMPDFRGHESTACLRASEFLRAIIIYYASLGQP